MRTRDPLSAKKDVAASPERAFHRATLRFVTSELELAIHFCKLAQSSPAHRERWVHSTLRSRDLAERWQRCLLLNYAESRKVALQLETLETLFHQMASMQTNGGNGRNE
jgi:hypothetical protein